MIGLGIIIFLLFVAVLSKKNKVRQHYMLSPIANLPMTGTPEEFGYNPPYSVEFSKEEAKDLYNWWLDYSKKVDREVVDYIYALCPDMQWPASVNYYGLTDAAVRAMKKVKPILDHTSPDDLTNAEKVNALLGPTCSNIMNNQVGVVDKSGLYDDVSKDAGVADVF